MSEPTGIEIQDGKFWILETGEGEDKKIVFFDTIEPACKQLKEELKEKENTDGIKLLSVDCSKEDWSVAQVPWNDIVLLMLK